MRKVDIVIIGGGPAGSLCGYLLKKVGTDCLIVDRADFPRDKICGGGLTPKAWQLLQRLMPDFNYDYNPISHVKLDVDVNGIGSCEFESSLPIRIVRRRVFDYELLKQYLALGGELMKDSIKTIEEKGERILVTLKSGELLSCRYLVGADGSNSRVRRYLNPEKGFSVLAMEQYVPKSGENKISIELSPAFRRGGYFFRFPNSEFDVVGYGETDTTPDKFRALLKKKGVAETRFRGAYVSLSNDYPRHDHIILIGDAGGFANMASCEGLYYAFLTACHAAIAIIHDKPFCDVNRAVFRKERKEHTMTPILFSRPCLRIVKWLCRKPGLVKRVFDSQMTRKLPSSLYQQDPKIIPGLF